jgi:hypothetical protein
VLTLHQGARLLPSTIQRRNLGIDQRKDEMRDPRIFKEVAKRYRSLLGSGMVFFQARELIFGGPWTALCRYSSGDGAWRFPWLSCSGYEY